MRHRSCDATCLLVWWTDSGAAWDTEAPRVARAGGATAKDRSGESLRSTVGYTTSNLNQSAAHELLQRCPLPNQPASACPLAITDEASPLALRSTRNRLRRAVRRGAADRRPRTRQEPGR